VKQKFLSIQTRFPTLFSTKVSLYRSNNNNPF
jgi:hypothetical protein